MESIRNPEQAVTPQTADQQPAWIELKISFYSRAYDQWEGTRAQLEAESFSPPVWPHGRTTRYWTAGGFDFCLRRCRPEGHKGPLSSWTQADSWCLRRTRNSKVRDGFMSAAMHEKQEELREVIFRQSAKGALLRQQVFKAFTDKRFQKLMVAILPPKVARTRKSLAA